MPAQQQHWIKSAYLSGTTGAVAVGTALVSTGTAYVVATSANRASYGRAEGIALSAGDDDDRAVEIQSAGTAPNSVTGLGAGTATWVIVSSTGTLERDDTPDAGEDVIGRCNARGDVAIAPFVWDNENTSPGGSATPPGSDTQGIFNDGGAYGADAGWTYNKTSNRHLVTGGVSVGADPALTDFGLSEGGYVWWKQGGSEHGVIGVTAAGVIEIGATTGIPILIGSGLNQYITVEATELALDVTALVLGASGVGPTIAKGTGAPASTPPDGSIYLRTDGTSSTGIYTRQAGAWEAVGGGGAPGGSDGLVQYRVDATTFGGIAGASTDGTNLNVIDQNFQLLDDADTSKVARFQCSGITTATTRTYTLPDASDTLAVLGLAQTFTARQTFSGGLSGPGTVASAGDFRAASGSKIVARNAGNTGDVDNLTLGNTIAVGDTSAADWVAMRAYSGGELYMQLGFANRITVAAAGIQIGNGGNDFGGGNGVIGIDDCSVVPTTNATAGGQLYSESGAIRWRGSSGTATTMANAEPHCPRCGTDVGVSQAENDLFGEELIHCHACELRTGNGVVRHVADFFERRKVA